jgi:hypothetical protein
VIWFLAQFDSPYSPEYIKRIEEKSENFETLFFFLLLVSIFLLVLVVFQFLKIRKLSLGLPLDNRYKTKIDKPIEKKVPQEVKSNTKQVPVIKPTTEIPKQNLTKQSEIPDPGLIFKYILKPDCSREDSINRSKRRNNNYLFNRNCRSPFDNSATSTRQLKKSRYL